MFPRSISVLRAARAASRFQVARCSSHDVVAHGPTIRDVAIEHKSTMDDVTVPQGDWQTDYNKRQSRYHRNLIINVIIFIATVSWVKQVGALQWYGFPSDQSNMNIYED